MLSQERATLAATLYLILGAIGLPVFAGGGGGSKHSLVLQLTICWLIHFCTCHISKLSHAETPILENLWLLF
ncbi:MAG: biotin transporter BioY [Streptococcus agalactiae]